MAEYERQPIPYTPQQTLPYNNRYALLGNTPPSADDLDGDINYLIDVVNSLFQQFQGGVVVNLPDANLPANANKLYTTNGLDPATTSWTFIQTLHLVDSAVTTAKINNGAVDNTKIANAAVRANHIYAGSVTQQAIADGAVGENQLADESVTADKIEDNTITAAEIANNTITAQQIANTTITAAQIANNTITAQQIANNTITAAQLAAVIQPLIGSFVMWGGTATPPPAGYLAPNGQNVSRTTYAALFAVYQTTYGAGDGVNTFGLPDLRGRSLFHLDMTAAGTTAATNNRITTATANALTVGGVGGFQQITLDETQIPGHIHTIPYVTTGNCVSGGSDQFARPAGVGEHTNTSSTGGDQPHNNMTPFMFCQYLIYAGV